MIARSKSTLNVWNLDILYCIEPNGNGKNRIESNRNGMQYIMVYKHATGRCHEAEAAANRRIRVTEYKRNLVYI